MSFTAVCLLLIFLYTQRIVWSQSCPGMTDRILACENSPSPDSYIGSLNFGLSDGENDEAVCPRSNAPRNVTNVTLLNASPGIFCLKEIVFGSSADLCSIDGVTLLVDYDRDSEGFLDVEFISSELNKNITIRYGPPGVHPFNETRVEVEEGIELVELGFIVFSQEVREIGYLFEGMNFTGNVIPRSICSTSSSETTKVYFIQIVSPKVNASGQYVAFDRKDKSLNATITLIVVGSPSPSPSLVSSLAMTMTTPIFSPSSSSSPTGSPPTADPTFPRLVVYVVVGVGGVFSVAILIIVGVLVFLCCKYKHWKSPHPRQYSPDGVDVDLPTTPTKNGSPNVKSTSIPRLGSTSSERPLTQGESSSSINTPTSENYTAVYCSSNYSKCGQIIADKHGDRIRIVKTWEEVRSALIEPFCTDILVIADPDDKVFREIMCCGVDPPRPSKREKLRFIRFTKEDAYPENTIGINGYRFVLVEGPPDLNSLLTAINKAEYPELVKQSRRNSGPREEVDHHDDPPILREQKKTNFLLEKLVDHQAEAKKITKKALEETKKNTELNRDRNELLTNMQGTLETHNVVESSVAAESSDV